MKLLELSKATAQKFPHTGLHFWQPGPPQRHSDTALDNDGLHCPEWNCFPVVLVTAMAVKKYWHSMELQSLKNLRSPPIPASPNPH